jgi:uncharacterized protein involved in exopolysaccharide biosynthesis
MGLDVLNKGHNRTLGDIIALFWAAKLYIIGFMLVLGSLSILWLMAQPNYYRATMLIGPVEPLFSSADKALYEAQDAYSATPIYKMQRRDSAIEFQRMLKMMRSEAVAASILPAMQDVLPYFKGEADKALPWRERYGFDASYRESLTLSQILKDRLTVQPDGLTPFYQVSILMSDRALAPALLSQLYHFSDRKLLASLIVQEEYSLMSLQAGGAFAAQIVEAPYLSPYVVWPKPFMALSAVTLISFMFGSVLFGFIAGLKQRKA